MSIESLVDSITSPNLQDDDYGSLLDLVELVNSNPSENVQSVLRLLKVKLQSSNANILLRSITLLDFLAENCGAMMKAQIANSSFINDNLLPIINDNLIHLSVKESLITEFYKLSKSFQNDESLSIVKITFNNLKLKYPDLCNNAIIKIDGKNAITTTTTTTNNNNPTTTTDDDIELKKAIELSLRDSSIRAPISAQSPNQIQSSSPQLQNNDNTAILQSHLLEEDISKPDKVIALYDLSSDDEDTLSFKKNDIIIIVEEINNDWLRGCLHGRAGLVPTNYIKKLPKINNNDLKNLINSLNDSFDIETTLSQLMDLNKKVKSSNLSSQQFESNLLKNNFPNKIQKIESIKDNLSKIIELHKLKLLELQSLQSNIDNSLQIYQNLISNSNPLNNNTTNNTNTNYPDISSLSINSSNMINGMNSPNMGMPMGMNQISPQLQQPQLQPQLQPQMQPQMPTTTGSANYLMKYQQQQHPWAPT